jgi:hypothetical protein
MFPDAFPAVVTGHRPAVSARYPLPNNAGVKAGSDVHFLWKERFLLFRACLMMLRARNTSIGTGRWYLSIMYRAWLIVFDARQKS